MNSTALYIVVPCYNEQEVLNETAIRLADKLARMYSDGLCSDKSRILFVDDGSKDGTWDIICDLHNNYDCFCGLKLAHNRGHQNALWAGLMASKEQAVCLISIDADLQDAI